jgi:predicted membrane-bound spermidine synthase
MSRYVKPSIPDLQQTGVEIDPEVIPLAYKYFGLRPEDAKIVNQDGRVYINSTEQKYSVIIVDAYSQEIYIPYHMSTLEFFTNIRERLVPGGIMAFNINSTDPKSRLMLSFQKTMLEVFPYVYTVKAGGELNYVVFASICPINISKLDKIPADSQLQPLVYRWKNGVSRINKSQTASGMILTDDKAPIEMMIHSMIFGYVNE